MRGFLSLVVRFRSDERGAFLVIFGVMAIVLVATSGAVVDYTAIEQARTRAQTALDTAALGLQPTMYESGVTETVLKTESENLLVQQLNATGGEGWAICDEQAIPPCVRVDDVVPDMDAGTLHLEATVKISTAFVALIGFPTMQAKLVSEAARGSMDVEVAVALDTTGSMSGQKIIDLRAATNELIDILVKDVQTPTYSKLAFVPYSMGVNVGSYAEAVRGPITGPTAITGASWSIGTSKSISGASWSSGSAIGISGATRANPARITTSARHGLVDGDTVYITGVRGMTQLNNKAYVVDVTSTTQFNLVGVNSTSYGTYSSSSSDTMRKCQVAGCAAVVTTSSSHGFATNDYVYVTGVGGMTQINTTGTSTAWQISVVSSTRFSLNGTFGPAYGTYSSRSSDTVRECQVAGCEVVVTTSPGHGLASNDYVYISGVNGMTQINNSTSNLVWQINSIAANKYSLDGTFGPSYGSYSSSGSSFCVEQGCQYYYFQNAWSGNNLHQVSTCATERITSPYQYTDEPPTTALFGRNYPSTRNPCVGQTIVPLTSDKDLLRATADNLAASGSTGGHIGLAWAWYMIAPKFAYLWPEASKPASADKTNVLRAVILMTDGAFNTVYYNGVISKDSISGSGSAADHINGNAPNGSSLSQGAAQCAAIKAAGITVYTVGFDIGSDAGAQNLMANCASDSSKAYLASNGAQLKAAFEEIGQNITSLRISK